MSEVVYSQLAGRYDMVIDQGQTFNEVFQLCTNDAGTTYFDITNYTPKAEIRNVKNGSLIATFTCAIVAPGTNGQVQVQMSKTDTAALDFSGQYYWDLIITYATASYRVVEGSVQLSKSVTTA